MSDSGLVSRLSFPVSALQRFTTLEVVVHANEVQMNQAIESTTREMRAGNLEGRLANKVFTLSGRKALAQIPKNIAVATAMIPPAFGRDRASAREIRIMITVAP